jgi:molybdate transport system ATP-binding protein
MRLELEELQVEAGSFRLGPISLALGEGEYLIVLGPSGAGKTVTLETIAGLRSPAAGRIRIAGREVTRAAPESRRVGMLFQDSLLFPHLSVRQNLAYGAHRQGRARARGEVGRLAELLCIEPLMERRPRGLSGGERQRVALGRALASGPEVLLLDEPMAALDPNSREELRRTLLELHRELGTATVHVTHSFAEALALGDRVAVLIGGRLHQAGPPQEVFAHPASPTVARFLRSATVAPDAEPVEPGEDAVALLARGLRLAVADGTGAAPRLSAQAAQVTPATSLNGDEMLAGRVIAAESDGHTMRLVINVGIELSATLEVGAVAPGALAPGAPVWVKLGE